MKRLNNRETYVYLCMKNDWDMAKAKAELAGFSGEIEDAEADLLEKFEKRWDVITLFDEDRFFIPDCVPELDHKSHKIEPPLAFRAIRSAIHFEELRQHSYKTVFVLDDDITIYKNVPTDINVFGYQIELTKDGTRTFLIMDSEGYVYLRTKSLHEMFWFVAFMCQYLLVANKSKVFVGLENLEKDLFYKYFMERGRMFKGSGYPKTAVFAIPGKTDCYANLCLKTYRQDTYFVDKWSDISDVINMKKIHKGGDEV